MGDFNAALPVIDTASQTISGVVTVGTTAVPLKIGADRLSNRKLLAIKNTSDNTIFLGDATVNVLTGFPITRGEMMAISSSSEVYAVAYSNGNKINIIEAN